MTRFASFEEFYPHYLGEHQNRACRRLHFTGTALLLILLLTALATRRWSLLWLLPVVGYGFAWTGHFLFERNQPATFHHPLYSLAGDFRVFLDILRGHVSL